MEHYLRSYAKRCVQHFQKGEEQVTSNQYAAVITCFDGRVQEPVSAWVKAHASTAWVDVITTHAPEFALTDGSVVEVKRIQEVVRHAMTTHDLRLIALAGHADCEGNPVGHAEQAARIVQAVAVLSSWGLGLPVVGLWVDARGRVEEVQAATLP